MLQSAHRSIALKKDLVRNIDTCRELCGKLVIANIVDGVIRSRSTRSLVNGLTQRHREVSNASLQEFTVNDKIYEIRIELIRKLVSGEYYNIRDFETKHGPLPEDVDEFIGIASDFILENVTSVFKTLSKQEKHNYNTFERVVQSPKVKGMYYYREYPQESFGIVIAEKS